MATRYIDPNIQLPQSATGVASFYPAVLDALIAANNLTALTDAKNLPNAISAAGAIDPTFRFHTLAVTGTTAYPLANGSYPGQQVTAFVISGASIPNGTITPATPTGFANVTALGALGDLVTFMWTGAGWVIVSANGVTVA